MKQRLLLPLLLFFSSIILAQTKGTISGVVTDGEMNGEPLPFANVLIKGTTIGTTTEFEGDYTLKVSPGTYTVVFSFVGYETIEVPNVVVKEGENTKLNKTMKASQGMQLEEVQVTATTKKESEKALLAEQKKAIAIEQKIGQQELSRKGVGDVATALTKTTGISKQEGSGNIFVRGLGDRYNITTLNGLPLPSNNPSKKNIDLGIFSTDIVEYIGVDKTYNVKNYGDFAGANVNISSKYFTGEGFVELGLGIGINSEVFNQDKFYLFDGPNFTGFYKKDYPEYPLNNYNFNTSWDREVSKNPPVNQSYSIKLGDAYQLSDETRLSVFAVASFDGDYKYKEGISRGAVNVSGVARKDYKFQSYSYNTNTTLMGNLGLKTGIHKFKYNVLFINTSSQKQEEYTGTVDAFDYAPEGGAFVQRATFERTQLLVQQLLGEHKITDNFDINWGASYNTVDTDIPNRKQNIVTPDNWDKPEGSKSFSQTVNTSDNNRYYQDLGEKEFAANISAAYKFAKNEDDEYRAKFTLGYSGRFKEVSFAATQFNFRINNRGVSQPIIEDVYNLDAYFNQASFDSKLFTIETFRGGLGIQNALDPQTYDGKQKINAGFASFEYAISPKFKTIVGVRGEKINQNIEWSTSLDPDGDKSDLDSFELLPMVSLKYELTEDQNLKFAASRSYTLPQYKERALFQFEEVTQAYVGNPSLYSSTDYNADIKWELFPKSDEIIALGVFGKYIENPINSVTINSATNDVSWVNSGDNATAYGAEFEMRKTLYKDEVDYNEKTLNSKLNVGFNVSYMKTLQKLDKDKVIKETTAAGFPISVDFTDSESRISGASDLLFNVDFSYFKEFRNDMNIQSTIVFNYFSDRIFALGTEGKGDLLDSGLGTLDFVLKSKLSKRLSLGLSAKNLLNPTIERKQEVQNVLVSSYKLGTSLKLSINYKF